MEELNRRPDENTDQNAWLLSWLHCGALIHVDAPGCGTSVVRGWTGHK